jgi:hypothetical protein
MKSGLKGEIGGADGLAARRPNSPVARDDFRHRAGIGDPIGDGVVASLAHPGSNITGSTFLGPALVPKGIELLKEALVGVSRVAALWHPGAYGGRTMRDRLTFRAAPGNHSPYTTVVYLA